MGLALVLGGGGAAAVAWQAGVLAGLAETGIDLARPARVVGTSAGAVVGAFLATGTAPADLPAMVAAARELFPRPRGGHDVAAWDAVLAGGGDRAAVLRRVGRLADAAGIGAAVGAGFVGRLTALFSGAVWPQIPELRITAIDADSGAVAVWDGAAGIDLVAAIGASCAVPGLITPQTIGDRRYFDGGVATPTHADQAAGCAEVLVLAPFTESIFGPVLDRELDGIAARSRTAVIVPDPVAAGAFSADPFDTTGWPVAARAGLAQGRAEALRISMLLSL